MNLLEAAERVQRASEGRRAILDLTDRPDMSFGEAADVACRHAVLDEIRVTYEQQHDWSVEARMPVTMLAGVPLTVGFAEPQGLRFANWEVTRFRLENGGVVQAAPPHQP